jgi:hypothetical protein
MTGTETMPMPMTGIGTMGVKTASPIDDSWRAGIEMLALTMVADVSMRPGTIKEGSGGIL